MDARDQLLPDVAREVEVDIGERGQLLVQEPADQQVVGDRVDVRQAGQEADDRGDARTAAPAGRQQAADAAGTAHLERHLAGQLEHVVVEQEEPGQTEPLDDPKLLLQPRERVRAHRARVLVPILQAVSTQLGERAHRRRVLRPRIAVPEVAGQIEPQPLGQRQRLRHRLGMVCKSTRHRRRRGEHVAEVAAPHGLGGIERGVQAYGHQRVLERCPGARVRVHVPGGHARHPEPRRDSLKAPVAGAIVAQERPLELDPQAIGSERAEQAPERELVVHPAQRTAAQADQPLGVLQDVRELDERLRRRAPAFRACAHARGSGFGTGSTSRPRPRRAASGGGHRERHPARGRSRRRGSGAVRAPARRPRTPSSPRPCCGRSGQPPRIPVRARRG